jgi:putative hemolysin
MDKLTYKTRIVSPLLRPDLVRKAQRLRYRVFHEEFGEGKEHLSGLDSDAYDSLMDHLLILTNQEVVGTYRLWNGRKVRKSNKGFYSSSEFDFTPFKDIEPEIVELGRACVHEMHRSGAVINLLLKGIARYALRTKSRYLIGCSSLPTLDEKVGATVYDYFKKKGMLAPTEFQTIPLNHISLEETLNGDIKEYLPPLLRTYLMLGAKICGPPCRDQDFRTIDFLTLTDLKTIPERARKHFLEGDGKVDFDLNLTETVANFFKGVIKIGI